MENHHGVHAFPQQALSIAYAWFDWHLKERTRNQLFETMEVR